MVAFKQKSVMTNYKFIILFKKNFESQKLKTTPLIINQDIHL